MTIKLRLPSQRKLREDFTYNAATGDLLRYDGYFGSLTRNGYWYLLYEDHSYFAHRLIWKWWYGYDPEEIDHINGDKQDNRIDNLRNVPHKINCRNRPKLRNNTSGFNGVTWYEQNGKWNASLWVKKRIHIGNYNTPQEAKEARDEFIKEFFPELVTERHGT